MESAVFLRRTYFNNSDFDCFESNPSFILILDKTVEVNQPRDNVYIFACLPVLFITLIVNIMAMVVLGRKEQNSLNYLIIRDCLVNMVTMFLSVAHQLPWFIGWPHWVCVTYGQTCKMSKIAAVDGGIGFSQIGPQTVGPGCAGPN